MLLIWRQITYTTNGTVYVADREDYNVVFNPGELVISDDETLLMQLINFLETSGKY